MGRASFFSKSSCYPLALMINSRRHLFLPILLFLVAISSTAQGGEYYMHAIGGAGNYITENDQFDGAVIGLDGGIQASDELSFEGAIEHIPVDTDDYYFTLLGARYRFLKADFLMEPSVSIHAGVLIPIGDKSSMDGVAGVGLELLYRTHSKIEFGPKIESTLVFAGPNKDLLLSYVFVVGYRF